jgi:hypothetical protein
VDVVEEVDLSEIMAIMRSPEKLEEARSDTLTMWRLL